MKLRIRHSTRYDFDAAVPFGLQQLRKTPKSFRSQKVLEWRTEVTGGQKELSFDDYHRNKVELISFESGTRHIELLSEGVVELTDTHGVTGPHEGTTPLWLFERATDLTKPGKLSRELVRGIDGSSELDRLHALSAELHARVEYTIGASHPDWTTEKVLEEGKGVCQDHAHAFLTCARLMGHPARYVSGYLMMDGVQDQDAMHAWAEAHVDGLGWVGFDVSNGISPDARYVRVATGLDYSQAAPVLGTRLGDAGETLSVALEVAQQ
ncbi:transglutaminase family protein [Shimia biformata]|uniref:transglutaminase family protein n=1 Tax=Shimia biformata TaxID=1294299 RepID=UPI0019515D60|nr:transglutaminase family protein [Shimia biformata]